MAASKVHLGVGERMPFAPLKVDSAPVGCKKAVASSIGSEDSEKKAKGKCKAKPARIVKKITAVGSSSIEAAAKEEGKPKPGIEAAKEEESAKKKLVKVEKVEKMYVEGLLKNRAHIKRPRPSPMVFPEKYPELVLANSRAADYIIDRIFAIFAKFDKEGMSMFDEDGYATVEVEVEVEVADV